MEQKHPEQQPLQQHPPPYQLTPQQQQALDASSSEGYLYSFNAETPTSPLQTFAHQGQAPYGYPRGYEPRVVTPNPVDVPEGRQPVYHIKVTATPVKLSPGVVAPEYVVTADPSAVEGAPAVCTSNEGTIITHVAPDILALGRQGFTIKPLQKYEIPSSSGAPAGPPPPGASPAGQAMVHVYAGEGAAATRDLVAREQMAKAPAPLPGRGAATAPGIQLLETGYGRKLSAEGLAGTSALNEKIYNWIIPTGGEPPVEETAPEENKGFVQSLFGKLMGRGPAVDTKEGKQITDASKLFTAASMQVRERLEEEEEKKGAEEDEAERGGQRFDLESLLKPSVKYGGVQYASPEFVGQKDSLHYKLHAVEVHQYIPLPSAGEPWFFQHHLDPSTQAIFGPMPLPFDPCHSGMVAPTFQTTVDSHPTPLLSPEMARMFNHELPIAGDTESLPKPAA